MKKNEPYYGWLFAVVSLLILLGISIYLGVSGWYFSSNLTQTSDMVLGNTVEMSIKENQSTTCSFTLSGAYLPEEELPQIISVKNSSEKSKVFLRAKIYIFMESSTIAKMSMNTNTNWYLGDDGYYYYRDELIEQGKASVCSGIVIGQDSMLCGEKSYVVTILVESLDSSLDVETIWGLNPHEL